MWLATSTALGPGAADNVQRPIREEVREVKICENLIKVPIKVVTIATHGITGEVLYEGVYDDFIYEPLEAVMLKSVPTDIRVTN